MDKRKFHCFLNELKDQNEDYIELIESIQQEFDKKVETITDAERKALKQYPIQYVKRIPEEKGEWTTQLHIWAEHGIPEIVKLEPIYLSLKNSNGDTVLMSLVIGATGIYTEIVNYDLIKEILNTDMSYEDIEKTKDGNETVVVKNVLDEQDLNDQTPIDFLMDFAFGTDKYQGQEPDLQLQQILTDFSKNIDEPKDKLKGGKSDAIPVSEVDTKSLEQGTKVEMEHVDDKDLAQEIAKDHIAGESTEYYDKLKEMEKELEKDVPKVGGNDGNQPK